MPSLVAIGQQIKEKRRGEHMPPSLSVLTKYTRTDTEKFQSVPSANFKLYVISLICTNFEAFATFSAIFRRIRRTIIRFSETSLLVFCFLKL